MLMSDGVLFVGPIDDPRRYQINAEAALSPLEGGEGLVYSAVDSRSGERVAVKMLTTARPDDYGRVVSRLLPFIEIDHPNVMQQRDVFLGAALASHPPDDPVEYEIIYSVADWIDGEPLSQINHDDDWRSAFTALSGLAQGLATLAEYRSDISPRGLVHRDVKPSNVRLTPDGQLVLIDLGVARPLDDDDLTKGVGTYRWRAPEVLSGAATTAATDAWGLGAIAYWLLVGEPPGLEGAATSRERILGAERTRQLNDPAGIATHIAQLLQTTPAERPGDLNKWARQLDAILTARTTRTQRRIATGATLLAIPAIALTLLVARVNPTAQSEPLPIVASNTETPSIDGTVLGEDAEGEQISSPSYRFVALTVEGGVAAAAMGDGSTMVWHLDPFRETRIPNTHGRPPGIPEDGTIWAADVHLSEDGARLMVVNSGQESAGIWDVETATKVSEVPGFNQIDPLWHRYFDYPMLSRTGERLVGTTYDYEEDVNYLEIWDTNTGELFQRVPDTRFPASDPRALSTQAFRCSYDLTRCAVNGPEAITIYDTLTWTPIGVVTPTVYPDMDSEVIDFFPSENWIIVLESHHPQDTDGFETRHAYVYNLITGSSYEVLLSGGGRWLDDRADSINIEFRNGGEIVLIRSNDVSDNGVIAAIETATGELVRYSSLSHVLSDVDWLEVEDFALSGDWQTLGFIEYGVVSVKDATTGDAQVLPNDRAPAKRMWLDRTGEIAVTGAGHEALQVFNTRTAQRLAVLDVYRLRDGDLREAYFYGVHISSNGDIVVLSSSSSLDLMLSRWSLHGNSTES